MFQQFQLLKPTSVTLLHVNIRNEKHGKKKARAIDLKVMLSGGNQWLRLLHEKLPQRFYEAEEKQEDIADVEPILPNLTCKQFGRIEWLLEMTGMDVTVVYGTGDSRSNFDLVDCKVTNFWLKKLKEEGFVEIEFRISTSHIPDGALDKLSRQLDGPLEITLIKNEQLIKQAVIDGAVGLPKAAAAGAAEGKEPDPLTDGASKPPAGHTGPWPFPGKGTGASSTGSAPTDDDGPGKKKKRGDKLSKDAAQAIAATQALIDIHGKGAGGEAGAGEAGGAGDGAAPGPTLQ